MNLVVHQNVVVNERAGELNGVKRIASSTPEDGTLEYFEIPNLVVENGLDQGTHLRAR
ncbi:hypothetical protein D3C87_1718010 [compost metagenome]